MASACHRMQAAVSGMSRPTVSVIGLPASMVSMIPSSRPLASISSAQRTRIRLRSPGLRRDQRPSSAARRAAATARSTSAGPPCATSAIGRPVAGFSVTNRPPPCASRKPPSMNSCVLRLRRSISAFVSSIGGDEGVGHGSRSAGESGRVGPVWRIPPARGARVGSRLRGSVPHGGRGGRDQRARRRHRCRAHHGRAAGGLVVGPLPVRDARRRDVDHPHRGRDEAFVLAEAGLAGAVAVVTSIRRVRGRVRGPRGALSRDGHARASIGRAAAGPAQEPGA